jgi:IS5 family transposase
MKTFTDFALKEEYRHLQPVEDKFTEIDSLIAWKFFHIIFESIYFNKTIFYNIHV